MLNFLLQKKTALRVDFNPKSVIIFKNTNMKEKNFKRWFKPKNHLTLLSL